MEAPCLLVLLTVLLAPLLSAQEAASPEGATEVTFQTRNEAAVDVYIVDPTAEAASGQGGGSFKEVGLPIIALCVGVAGVTLRALRSPALRVMK